MVTHGSDIVLIVALCSEIEQYMSKKLKTEHYHLAVKPDGADSFLVSVPFGLETKSPTPRETCISCDTDNEVSKCSAAGSSKTNKWWIDAKGRPSFVVTPKRHVEPLGDLSDDELYALWADTCTLLHDENKRVADAAAAAAEAKSDKSKEAATTSEAASAPTVRFEELVINQGGYRNLVHLHLKIRVSKEDFAAMQKVWPQQRLSDFKRLIELASDKSVFSSLIGGSFKNQVPSLPLLRTWLASLLWNSDRLVDVQELRTAENRKLFQDQGGKL